MEQKKADARLPQPTKKDMETTSSLVSVRREGETVTQVDSSQWTQRNAPNVGEKADIIHQGKESKMVNAKKKSTIECGENSIEVKPEKVEKLEADPYLLEKALKVQEASFQRKLELEMKHRREEMNHKKNIIKRLRKQERQNKRKGRK